MHMSRAAPPPHAKLLGMRILKLVTVTLLIAPLPFVACASSTAASIELWTDIDCEDLNSSVFIATDLATAQKNARSATEVPDRVVGSQSIEYDCSKLKHTSNSGFYKLGDLTVFPKIADNARVAVVVSVNDTKKSAAAKSASDCRAEAQVNNLSNQCMEIAATFDYRANDTRRVIVRLTKSCFGVVCATGDTCVNEQCVSAKASVLTGTETPNKTPSPGEVEASDAGPAPKDSRPSDAGPTTPDSGTVEAGLSDTGPIQLGDAHVDGPLSGIMCMNGVASLGAQNGCGTSLACVDTQAAKATCESADSCSRMPGRYRVCCKKAVDCCMTLVGMEWLPLAGADCTTNPSQNINAPKPACFSNDDCSTKQRCRPSTRGFSYCEINQDPQPQQEAGVGIDPVILVDGNN
jgi:hypothetical protein